MEWIQTVTNKLSGRRVKIYHNNEHDVYELFVNNDDGTVYGIQMDMLDDAIDTAKNEDLTWLAENTIPYPKGD